MKRDSLRFSTVFISNLITVWRARDVMRTLIWRPRSDFIIMDMLRRLISCRIITRHSLVRAKGEVFVLLYVFFISPYSVAFGVILSLLCCFFVFVCLYGWGYLLAEWCDWREILAQGRANTRDGNVVVRGWSAHGDPWGGGLNIFWGEGTYFRE